jgi:hypothetical protein
MKPNGAPWYIDQLKSHMALSCRSAVAADAISMANLAAHYFQMTEMAVPSWNNL